MPWPASATCGDRHRPCLYLSVAGSAASGIGHSRPAGTDDLPCTMRPGPSLQSTHGVCHRQSNQLVDHSRAPRRPRPLGPTKTTPVAGQRGAFRWLPASEVQTTPDCWTRRRHASRTLQGLSAYRTGHVESIAPAPTAPTTTHSSPNQRPASDRALTKQGRAQHQNRRCDLPAGDRWAPRDIAASSTAAHRRGSRRTYNNPNRRPLPQRAAGREQ